MSDHMPGHEGKQQQSQVDPIRRMLLSTFGSTLALAACAGGDEAAAQEKKNETFNAYNRMRGFEDGELDSGTPWVASKQGNFDLEDPIDNNLARLKMTNNLVGERTYIPMLVRLYLAREQQPGGILLGAAGMFTWQLQEPDPKEFPDAPKGSCVLRSLFTSRVLEPETMEPADRFENPFNGKMMDVEDNIFGENFITYPLGGTRFIEEPQFQNDDPTTPKFAKFKKWGDELVLFQGGTYSEPGNHQPRFTENMWRSNYKDVMDPEKSLIEMNYSFSGANKAFEKPWAGYTEDDHNLLIDLAIGKKAHSINDIPDFHKRVVIEKYPDRI